MSPINDELTAVARRPRRSPLVLAFLIGVQASISWGGSLIMYRRLQDEIATRTRSIRAELEVERQAREASRSVDNIRDYVLQIRIESVEHDNLECHGFVSLP